VRQVNSGGPTTPNPDWVEATLDVQVVAQVASGLEAFDLYSYNGNPTAPRANFLEMLALPINPEVHGDAPPDIVSVSYALCEAVSWKPFTPVVDIAERMLASVATTGMSYLVAAGDSGSSSCLHNGFDNQEVNPAYPSTSAWVTAVGGTSLTLAPDNSIAGESVWNDTLFPPPYFVAGSAGTGGTSVLVERPA
jgi:subtilase family serine protease